METRIRIQSQFDETFSLCPSLPPVSSNLLQFYFNSTFNTLSFYFRSISHRVVLSLSLSLASSKGLRSRSTTRTRQQITCKSPENFIFTDSSILAERRSIDVGHRRGRISRKNRSLQSRQIASIQFYNSKTICIWSSSCHRRRESAKSKLLYHMTCVMCAYELLAL